MEKLTAKWTLRTDGRTVSDDIDDLHRDPERYQQMLDTIREPDLCPLCGTAYHADRIVQVDKAGNTCSGLS